MIDQWRVALRFLALAVTSIAYFLPTAVQAQVTAERPNIIIILANDLGFRDVGFTGATEIFTPTIDALAPLDMPTIGANAAVTASSCQIS